jgi:hypothetical protein
MAARGGTLQFVNRRWIRVKYYWLWPTATGFRDRRCGAEERLEGNIIASVHCKRDHSGGPVAAGRPIDLRRGGNGCYRVGGMSGNGSGMRGAVQMQVATIGQDVAKNVSLSPGPAASLSGTSQ